MEEGVVLEFGEDRTRTGERRKRNSQERRCCAFSSTSRFRVHCCCAASTLSRNCVNRRRGRGRARVKEVEIANQTKTTTGHDKKRPYRAAFSALSFRLMEESHSLHPGRQHRGPPELKRQRPQRLIDVLRRKKHECALLKKEVSARQYQDVRARRGGGRSCHRDRILSGAEVKVTKSVWGLGVRTRDKQPSHL
uniref:NADPH:adrenodoxin oxidoreductase n=1 Tax=Schistocephalus solidus TaxID=70667 RepID=A0A0X3P934_SCHSO